jgi:hypothetical protein
MNSITEPVDPQDRHEWDTSRTRAWFPSLGVACTDHLVWRMGPPPRVLGPLTGATATLATGRCRWTHRPCARVRVTAGTGTVGTTLRGMQQLLDGQHEARNFTRLAAEAGILDSPADK